MGKIVTFYSYKGGVGRTFALANIGAILASWGYKVLCVDWDLEAPGLHEYFAPYVTHPLESGGVLRWVMDRGPKCSWQDNITATTLARLTLMHAGGQTPDYARKVQNIRWDKLYQKGLGTRIETLRSEWIAEYDFVLVDSRTGISDIGGVRTVQLPDILVCLFTTNRQNLEGTNATLRSVIEQRRSLPIDRPTPYILPILSRVESRVEYEQSQAWISRVAETLGWAYSNWIDTKSTPRLMVERTRLPYIPFWSYDESLPAVEKGINDPEDIGYRLASIAMLLARGLAESDLFINNRDSYLTKAWDTLPVAPDTLRITAQANALVIKAEGLAEEIGEIVCTIESGMFETTSTGEVLLNVTVFLNTNLTSRLRNDPWSEAVALLEDLRSSAEPISISGRNAGANAILFTGIRISLSPSKKYRLAIRRIRCNANQLGISSSLTQTSVGAAIEFSDAKNPRSKIFQQMIVTALVQPGISVRIRNTSPQQVRIVPQVSEQSISVPSVEEANAEITVAEGYLGAFQNRAETSGDCGTRFIFRFLGLPPKTRLFVSKLDQATAFSSIELVKTDANGGGGVVKQNSSSWIELYIEGSSAQCVWEWLAPMNAGRLESRGFRVGVKLVGPSISEDIYAARVAVCFAPLSTVTTASSSAPIPRFADTSTVRLLFPPSEGQSKAGLKGKV